LAKSEWGTKRTCRSCGGPFYDLKKKNIECPKCGAAFNPNPPARPKRPAPAAKAIEQDVSQVEVPAAAPAAAAPANDDAATVAGAGKGADATDPNLDGDDLVDAGDSKDDEKDDALIEDTSDLSRDDDDVSEVKEHIDSGVEDKN